MKRIIASVCLVASLFACQDETKQLLKKIDGNWQVNTITFSGGSKADSSVTISNAFLNFDVCSKAENQQGPSTCSAGYTVGNQSYPFNYQAPNGNKSLYISPTNRMDNLAYKQVADQLSGSYEVVTLSDNQLVLRRSLPSQNTQYRFVQYSVSK